MEKAFLRLFTKLYGHHYPVIDMDIYYEDLLYGKFTVTLKRSMYLTYKKEKKDIMEHEFLDIAYEHVVKTGEYLGKRANIYPYLG